MPDIHPDQLTSIDNLLLVSVAGGAQDANQAELRQLAQQYCPATYNKFKNEKVITRPMAERCLDEAGYGWAKGRLDKYFPPTRR